MELRSIKVVDRENLDEVWDAMLRLPDGDALAREAGHLEWSMPPRGMDNTQLADKYGAGVLAWIRTRITADGVLMNYPWCVVPCLMALDDERALQLLLEVDSAVADGGSMARWQFTPSQVTGDARQALQLVLEWARRHPEIADRVLAASSLPRAIEARDSLARKRALDPAAMLAVLDEGTRNSWPYFNCMVDGRMEYFGLRVVGIRGKTGDGWAIVFERMQGCTPDAFQLFRYAFGPGTVNGFDVDHVPQLELEIAGDCEEVFRGMTAKGPSGELRLDESLFARFDLRPGFATEDGGWAARTLAIRAYLEAFPGAFWPPPEDALACAGVPGGEVIVASKAFFHVEGAPIVGVEPAPRNILPSASTTYRSLVDAIVARDASRFTPGESNLDWRNWASFADGFELPWKQPRASTDDGWAKAALAEAGGVTDGSLERLARGDGRYVNDVWVWDLDRTWATLLALPLDEAVSAFAKMELVDAPRGGIENRALAETFGDGALRFVKLEPAWLRGTLFALATPAAFGFAWDSDDNELFSAWMTKHPEVGYGELARRAQAGDAVARESLVAWGKPQVRRVLAFASAALGGDAARALFVELGMAPELQPQQILDALDHHAKQAGDAWPPFLTGAGPWREYHAMRLIAARDADGWLIVIERFEGYAQSCAVRRYIYSETLPPGLAPAHDVKPAGGYELGDEDAPLIETPDYFTQSDQARRRIAAIRAQDVPWPDAAALVAELGFGAPLVISTAFAHATGGEDLPSKSEAYRSLAKAIVSNDPTQFAPGTSNLAVSLHLRM